ncbi:hypothetical protein MGU_07547 [Metarhizium guizhouense ARSEF 977]|uniref:Uncharacterized protein n=1 Tax=Metarhizium guizhouense (strain ARSEF 977) TaxID=1276136 RepID=A0A0B4HZM6_METGA|nr:hypothetical protein MGU_07547 [Metarhizium guizhouense ARSEF 977]
MATQTIRLPLADDDDDDENNGSPSPTKPRHGTGSHKDNADKEEAAKANRQRRFQHKWHKATRYYDHNIKVLF